MKQKNRGKKRLKANVETNRVSLRPSSCQREVEERKSAPKTMKETFWSKLGELWAIRRRCQEIKLQRRQNRRMRSREFCDETRRLAKIMLPKRRPLRPTEESA